MAVTAYSFVCLSLSISYCLLRVTNGVVKLTRIVNKKINRLPPPSFSSSAPPLPPLLAMFGALYFRHHGKQNCNQLSRKQTTVKAGIAQSV